MIKHTVGVIGAAGFVGQHLLLALRAITGVTVRVLQHRRPVECEGCLVYPGNILERGTLHEFMYGCDVLINLAHPVISSDDGQYEFAIRNIAQAAREAGVARVLHLSTAMVAGTPSEPQVDESTEGKITTLYEKQKRKAEAIFQEELSGKVDLGILRPTAVFGMGGENLLKLLRTVRDASYWRRHLFRFIYGHRPLHLVSVQDVVSAIVFLAFLPRSLCGNVFIVARDGEVDNDYQSVDYIFGDVLSRPASRHSMHIPSGVLHVLLTLSGRLHADPRLRFCSDKLIAWGWKPQGDFSMQLKNYASAWYSGRSGRV